ncbi:hypothetical protein LTSEALA_3356, partial [Salmonella enterica subsp. enterica serovar Alachua str. R6-377]
PLDAKARDLRRACGCVRLARWMKMSSPAPVCAAGSAFRRVHTTR